jgi:hypothetical protein
MWLFALVAIKTKLERRLLRLLRRGHSLSMEGYSRLFKIQARRDGKLLGLCGGLSTVH